MFGHSSFHRSVGNVHRPYLVLEVSLWSQVSHLDVLVKTKVANENKDYVAN